MKKRKFYFLCLSLGFSQGVHSAGVAEDFEGERYPSWQSFLDKRIETGVSSVETIDKEVDKIQSYFKEKTRHFAQVKIHEQALASLEQKLRQAQEKAAAELAEKEALRKKLGTENASLKKENDGQKDTLIQQTDEITKAQEALKKAQEGREKAVVELKEKDALIKNLGAENESLKNQNAAQKENITQKDDQIKTAQEALKKAQEEQKKQLEALKETGVLIKNLGAENESLKNQNAAQKTTIAEKTDQAKIQQKELAVVQQQLTQEKEAREKQGLELKEKKVRIKTLEKENESQSQQLLLEKEAKTKAQQELERIQIILVEVNEENETLKSENTKLKEEIVDIDALKRRIRELESENQELKENLERMNTLHKDYNAQQLSVQRLEKENELLKANRISKESPKDKEITELKIKNKKYDEENKSLLRKIFSIEEEYSRLRKMTRTKNINEKKTIEKDIPDKTVALNAKIQELEEEKVKNQKDLLARAKELEGQKLISAEQLKENEKLKIDIKRLNIQIKKLDGYEKKIKRAEEKEGFIGWWADRLAKMAKALGVDYPEETYTISGTDNPNVELRKKLEEVIESYNSKQAQAPSIAHFEEMKKALNIFFPGVQINENNLSEAIKHLQKYFNENSEKYNKMAKENAQLEAALSKTQPKETSGEDILNNERILGELKKIFKDLPALTFGNIANVEKDQIRGFLENIVTVANYVYDENQKLQEELDTLKTSDEIKMQDIDYQHKEIQDLNTDLQHAGTSIEALQEVLGKAITLIVFYRDHIPAIPTPSMDYEQAGTSMSLKDGIEKINELYKVKDESNKQLKYSHIKQALQKALDIILFQSKKVVIGLEDMGSMNMETGTVDLEHDIQKIERLYEIFNKKK